MNKENQNLTELVIDTQNDVEGAFEKLYHKSFRHAYCTASLLVTNPLLNVGLFFPSTRWFITTYHVFRSLSLYTGILFILPLL